MIEMSDLINSKINDQSLKDVDKITASKVKEATQKLKTDKNDPIFEFSSDCLKNAPDILFEKLSSVIKSYLTHGHVSLFLLLATLVPIIKDKLADICTSKNYRSVAIGSLILKMIDWLIIILFGSSLGLDDLQFAYQANSSTTMCTWVVIEAIGYFLRNNSEVFTCLCDMSKAFDLVKISVLFRKVLEQGLPVIFARLLLVMYVKQQANVKWNNETSEKFPISNGVKQGAVLSAILYCMYMNGLFKKLRENKTGCWINNTLYGIIGYSDDNILMSPTLEGLQEMLQICESYAEEHNLVFSTDPNPKKSKTRCIAFLNKQRPLRKLILCGNPLPWKESGKHLGNKIVNSSIVINQDLKEKRAKFISGNMELCQEFAFAHPQSKVLVNSIYNSHFSGSPLWDLSSTESVQLKNSWNVASRIMLGVPRETHRFLLEPLTKTTHIRTLLARRFLGFIDQIKKSHKVAARNLLEVIKHDTQSVTGNNLRKSCFLVINSQ